MQSERQEGAAGTAIREQLRHIYWIGGGSGAGKSTIAHRIAAEHGLYLYATDEVMAEQSGRSTPQDCPFLQEFMAMDMDQRWLNRSPEEMLETFHWFRGEGFNMIIDDLLRLPADRRVVAEGFQLLPHLVKPLLSSSDHTVWLLPTPGFRRAAIERRGGWAFLAKTSDPARALENLLERDRMFTERLRKEVERLQLPAIEVRTGMAEHDCANLVVKMFGL